MLTCRGDIAPDDGKELSALERSERARDILLYFDHADILFCQMIGEGDLEIVEKSEYPFFEVLQTIEQVLGLGLFFAASFCRGINPYSPIEG